MGKLVEFSWRYTDRQSFQSTTRGGTLVEFPAPVSNPIDSDSGNLPAPWNGDQGGDRGASVLSSCAITVLYLCGAYLLQNRRGETG